MLKKQVRIAVVGDYSDDKVSHIKTNMALQHSSSVLDLGLIVRWVPTPVLTELAPEKLGHSDGILCAPGGPYDSEAGVLNAIRLARIDRIPFLGT